MMTSPLPYKARQEIVLQGLLSVLESYAFDLIHWRPTQQFLSPDAFVSHYTPKKALENPTFGFLNVRFFRVEDADDDCLMDTLGLGALGLTDFQALFRDREPNEMGKFLRDLGSYVLEKGDIIADGHSVNGPNDSKWVCERRESLLRPDRDVLDLQSTADED